MKWFVKNMKVLTCILYVIVAAVLVVAILNNFATTPIALSCALVLILFAVLSSVAQNKVLSDARARMNEKCDPEEYTNLSGALYKANVKSPQRTIDYCRALVNSNLKNYDSVKAALEQMQKLHVPITSKYVQSLFYVGLCDTYIFFEKFSLAENSYRKAMEAYQGIKSESQVEEIKDMLLICLVEILISKGDLERAEQEYNNIEEKNRKQKLDKLYLSAKLDMAKGDTENAKVKLELITEKANKLALVEKAECLLNGEKPYKVEAEQTDDDEEEEEQNEIAEATDSADNSIKVENEESEDNE